MVRRFTDFGAEEHWRITDFGAEEHWRITDFGAEEHWIYCILIYALFLSIGLTNVLFLLFVSRKQAKSTFALPSLFLRSSFAS